MPYTPDIERLRAVKTLPQLIAYLRNELGWPIDADNVDELTFDYSPEELGFDPQHAVKIREVKQLRPLETNQPWGIFWLSFEKKKLPMVVMRRILGNLITKSRASANKATRPTWQLHDLLFISSYGEEDHRNISFAHFSEAAEGQLPVLRVLGWDDQKSIMHLDRVANRLQSNLRWPDDAADMDQWRARWADAFTERYREAIQSADVLIQHLARLASDIRKRVADVLEAEMETGPMRRLFAAVRGLLIHDMTEQNFADMYAQTVSYGLLSASFSRRADLTPQNLVQLTAISNPFLENLLENLFRLNHGKFHFDVDEVGVNDVLDLLRNTNIEAIKVAFNDLNPAEDPVIRFYEGFLKAYDPQQRVKRGVFFTPRPVVSYIVRSVHELLQTEFGLEDGLASTATWGEVAAQMERRAVLARQASLSPIGGEGEGEGASPSLSPSPGGEGRGEGAFRTPQSEFRIPEGVSPDDPFVLILDIATGTATFLHECIEVIERTMKIKWARALGKPDPESPRAWRDPEILARWRDYVPHHLLPRLYGFEIMMAPYAIAHLKLALKLGETGYQFRDGDRLHIYLTNTLEEASPHADTKLADLFGPLAREAQEVNHIKRHKRFTVVIGNPPYSNFGQMNEIPFIHSLLDEYKRGLVEKKLNIDDDFIKFMRFAHHVLTTSGSGVLGMITNNVFIDGITHRRMRESLMESFSEINILDLHGSTRKQEVSPDGSPDENVFDIQQGVAVSLFLKEIGRHNPLSVAHADLWGRRESKYSTLAAKDVTTFDWRILEPKAEYFFFAPKRFDFDAEYSEGWTLTDIFPVQQNGLKTDRDELFMDFDRSALEKRIRIFYSSAGLSPDFRRTYRVEDSSSYDLLARRDKTKFDEANLHPCLYRPFDVRWLYYALGLTSRPAWYVMKHMLAHRNLALIACRQFAAHKFFTVNCTDKLTEISSQAYAPLNIFPLYLHSDAGEFKSRDRPRPNFTRTFVAALAARSGLTLSQDPDRDQYKTFGPEDAFHYIYAVLHSPGYRTRYAEFLKIDFPRLPLTGNLQLFRALARLGGELVALHLLESPLLESVGDDVRSLKSDSGKEGQRLVTSSPTIPRVEFIGGRNPEVEKVSFTCSAAVPAASSAGVCARSPSGGGTPPSLAGEDACATGTVWLDKAQSTGFRGVGEDVWNFHIGGYQVCEKWLKDRKGRILSPDDIAHYQKVVVALAETIRLMGEIDEVIEEHGGWPLK